LMTPGPGTGAVQAGAPVGRLEATQQGWVHARLQRPGSADIPPPLARAFVQLVDALADLVVDKGEASSAWELWDAKTPGLVRHQGR